MVEGDPGLPALLERLKMRRGRVAVEINPGCDTDARSTIPSV